MASTDQACTDAEPLPAREAPWITRKGEYVEHLAWPPVGLRISGADKRTTPTTSWTWRSAGVAAVNACVHQSLWYYEEISRVVSARMPGSRTAFQLEELVEALFVSVPVAAS